LAAASPLLVVNVMGTVRPPVFSTAVIWPRGEVVAMTSLAVVVK